MSDEYSLPACKTDVVYCHVRQPLKELVIFHHSSEYLADVDSLQSYIQEELNVHTLTLTSDEAAVNIRYKATADWPTLGRKLRKDIGKVKNGLPKLTSDEVKAYDESGKVTVDGIELVKGDLVVTRYVELGEGNEEWDSNTDGDFVLLLDIRKHAELETHLVRRDLTTRCQQLRKASGLQPADEVDIYYEFVSDLKDALPTMDLEKVMEGHEEAIRRKVGAVPKMLRPENHVEGKVLGKEEISEGGDAVYRLIIVERPTRAGSV